MAETLTPVRVLVGSDGTVEIQGISSTGEAEKVAKKLGLEKFEKLIRANAVSEEAINHVTGRARILGYELKVGGGEKTAKGGRPAAAPRNRSLPWKSVLGFGSVIVLLLALTATLTGVGIGIRDRIQHEYTPVATLAGALSLTQDVQPELSGLQALINPDDTRYISLTARNWILFGNGKAVLDGHYVQLEGLRAPLADLLKTGGTLTFHIDTRQSTRSTLFLEEILADGNPTGEGNASLRAWPLAMGSVPTGYPAVVGVEHDSKKTFESLGRIAVTGRLQRNDRGLRVFAGDYSVAVASELSPGLNRVLGHFVQDVDSEGNPVGDAAPSPLIFYMEMTETFPWSTDGNPDRRQLYQEIGAARLDGIELAGMYLRNS